MKPDALIDEAVRESFPASDPPTFMAGTVPGSPFRQLGEDDERPVRERAYFLWEREGRPEGRAAEHWQAAERGIERKKSGERDQGN